MKKYVKQGVVPLKNDSVPDWTTPYLGKEYTIKFDVMVTKELTEEWHNIFLLTTGKKTKHKFLARIPGVWARKKKEFYISSEVDGNVDYGKWFGYVLDVSYHFV